MPHEHKLVPLKVLYDDYIIYWCRLCGLVCEKINGKIYEMIPEYSKDRLLKEDRKTEKYKFLPIKPETKFLGSRLGKSLKEIQSPAPKFLQRLFKDEKS